LMLKELLRKGTVIPLGGKRVARLNEEKYVIYLPKDLNEIWRELHEHRKKINIYIEILD
jgi:shikimate kinase